MKKLLLLAVALVVVSGAGLAVANHYKNYQNKNKVQAVPTISVSDANKLVEQTKTAAGTEYQSLVVKYNQSVTECQKGVAAYAKLTAFVKQSTPAPVCPTPVAQ